jgi:hypothetical protein
MPFSSAIKGPVQPAYKPSFWLVFSAETIFFSYKKISQNSVSPCFFSEANGAKIVYSPSVPLFGIFVLLYVGMQC